MRLLSIAIIAVAACNASASPPPQVGTKAPPIVGQTHDGQAFDLAAKKGQWTVLYFYPKDGTPGCTKQACAFRDATKQLTDLGVAIYGISRDSKERHQKFAAEHRLPFLLIADPDGTITNAWGVSGAFRMSKRWTFVIDPELVVRDVQKDVDPALNAEQVAAAVKRFLAAPAASP
ncbi:MAG: peroxiredoxin [Deltaproteobacteria bacterium]|nr:peroxiredoxin [Deltaproteobacteria bacterium]